MSYLLCPKGKGSGINPHLCLSDITSYCCFSIFESLSGCGSKRLWFAPLTENQEVLPLWSQDIGVQYVNERQVERSYEESLKSVSYDLLKSF